VSLATGVAVVVVGEAELPAEPLVGWAVADVALEVPAGGVVPGVPLV
jgi:hypothetical protein